MAYPTPKEKASRLWAAKQWLDSITPIGWRVTSYIRNSPNHKTRSALDVAPYADKKKIGAKYSLKSMRDPLLPNRIELLNELLKHSSTSPKGVAYFVETDHIHIQLMKDEDQAPIIVRWPGPKNSCYAKADEDASDPKIGLRSKFVLPNAEADAKWSPFTGKTYDPNNHAVMIYHESWLLNNVLK